MELAFDAPGAFRHHRNQANRPSHKTKGGQRIMSRRRPTVFQATRTIVSAGGGRSPGPRRYSARRGPLRQLGSLMIEGPGSSAP
jgi:hypothetical protein